MEKINKNDFISFEFVASVKDGEIFDTNIESEAKKLGIKEKVKPSIISVGNEMIFSGLDKFFEGKEIGKDYSVDLEPKDAFGLRDAKLVRIYPLKSFLQKKINPYPGMMLTLDNSLAKVISVSGGRITLDLNNPLAGKNLIYKIKILKKIENLDEKISALKDYFFGPLVEAELKDSKIILKAPKEAEKFIMAYKDKFKKILNLEISFEEKEIKIPKDKEEKK